MHVINSQRIKSNENNNKNNIVPESLIQPSFGEVQLGLKKTLEHSVKEDFSACGQIRQAANAITWFFNMHDEHH